MVFVFVYMYVEKECVQRVTGVLFCNMVVICLIQFDLLTLLDCDPLNPRSGKSESPDLTIVLNHKLCFRLNCSGTITTAYCCPDTSVTHFS